MSKWLSVLAISAVLTITGCKNTNHHDQDMGSEPKKMSADACSHCPGVQTANADGKCPVCTGKK
jgi:hypothetical protein